MSAEYQEITGPAEADPPFVRLEKRVTDSLCAFMARSPTPGL